MDEIWWCIQTIIADILCFPCPRLRSKLYYTDTHLYVEKPLEIFAIISKLPQTGMLRVIRLLIFKCFLPFVHICVLRM